MIIGHYWQKFLDCTRYILCITMPGSVNLLLPVGMEIRFRHQGHKPSILRHQPSCGETTLGDRIHKLAPWNIFRFHLLWDTLPETNIAPENDGFPIQISFSKGSNFQVPAMSSLALLQALMTWCLDSALKRKSSRSRRMLLLEVWTHL